ncbi:MAG: SWIM zinc finger family protein [Acidobacteriota bacterium]
MATLAHTTPTLSRSESRFLAKLSALAGRSDPLRFIWQAINSRPAVCGDDPALWLVPSASVEDVSYTVDIDARTCSCEGFAYRRTCPHIAVAFFAARLLFEMSAGRSANIADCDSCFRPGLPA